MRVFGLGIGLRYRYSDAISTNTGNCVTSSSQYFAVRPEWKLVPQAMIVTESILFNMDAASQANMWQTLRDQATRTFASTQSNDDRIITVIQSALSNEAFMTEDKAGVSFKREELFKLLRQVTGTTDPSGTQNQDQGRN